MTRTFDDLKPVLELFWRGPRRKLLLGMLISTATILSGIALLGLSGWFITATAIAGMSAATALAFDVFSPSAGIRFFALARTASRYGERLITHDATLGTLAELRERLFRGSSERRAAEELRMRPAKLLFRITQDVDALDSLYLRVLVPLGAAFAAALAIGVALGLLHPVVGLAAGAFLIATGLAVPLLAARAAERPARRRAHALEVLRSRVIDLVSGQTELVMAGRLTAQRGKIADADRKLANADDRLNFVETAVFAAFGIANAILIAAMLLVVAALAKSGNISAPVASFAVLIVVAALEPFAALRRGAIELGRTRLAARRIGPRLLTVASPQRSDPPDGIAVSLDHVSVRHEHAPQLLLRDLSLSLRSGERLALIGESGAGKSTLLGVIAGEIPIEDGKVVSVPGTLLTQRTELFADSLRDNLRLADPTADDSQILHALTAAGLGAYIAGQPKGLDTRLGEGGLGLSGGEARRLALARLFLRDTRLWLLDEPTEGLDGATARDVIARLKANASGRTLVIATHIQREAEIADRLLIMKRGHVVASPRRGEAAFETALAALRQD
ncbi:thiol reductant ABC exporter subunit CydC [Hyphomicrobium facile]|uniref:ATP-binding cassette, subfamily C, CydC n=1 Tax=Hyphomicrobium facile TaxID=51670 RepID=A0A1I7N5I6_9HYPH|nr:thiol reductant ABC exporter subunit CydC [Hyphomicrobium facile]SFV29921.1 ATP-binding cassette, subfamily C, CydC [Hyphomicrobium facile]